MEVVKSGLLARSWSKMERKMLMVGKDIMRNSELVRVIIILIDKETASHQKACVCLGLKAARTGFLK